jgi:hypothetical protein
VLDYTLLHYVITKKQIVARFDMRTSPFLWKFDNILMWIKSFLSVVNIFHWVRTGVGAHTEKLQ